MVSRVESITQPQQVGGRKLSLSLPVLEHKNDYCVHRYWLYNNYSLWLRPGWESPGFVIDRHSSSTLLYRSDVYTQQCINYTAAYRSRYPSYVHRRCINRLLSVVDTAVKHAAVDYDMKSSLHRHSSVHLQLPR